MRIIRSLGRASIIAAALTLTLVSSVFGHECYNASASAQGNASKAEHSQTWVLAVDLRELIATGNSGFITGAPILSACQQEAFLTAWAQTGFPLVFTVGDKQATGQDNVIAENNPNMDTRLGGNGSGIDHFSVTGGAIMAALDSSYGAAFSANCP